MALAQAAGTGDLFAQIVAVLGLVLGSGGVLAVFTDRRKRRQEAEKLGAEAAKLGIDSQVSISGATLEWARDFRKEAQDARVEAAAATQSAREASTQADALGRDAANLREEIADLRAAIAAKDARLDQLLALIRECSGGSTCPVARAITQ